MGDLKGYQYSAVIYAYGLIIAVDTTAAEVFKCIHHHTWHSLIPVAFRFFN